MQDVIDSRDGDRGGAAVSRPVVVTAIVSVILVVIAGVAMVCQAWFGLRRFGGFEYIPRMVWLEIARAWGAGGAALAASFQVTALQHADSRLLRNRYRFAMLAAVAVPVLYTPVCALALGSSMIVAKAFLGLPPRSFFEVLEKGDVLHGAFLAVVFGCVPAVWSLFGTRLTRSRHRRLAFKLFVTWLAMLGVSFLVGVTIGLGDAG